MKVKKTKKTKSKSRVKKDPSVVRIMIRNENGVHLFIVSQKTADTTIDFLKKLTTEIN